MNYRKRIFTVLSLSALLFLAIGGVYSCTKIDETIDEAVDSFLKDFYSSGSDLTIEFTGDEAVIADFGDSYLGSNPAVIGVGDIYIKNITRTGPNTWSANIIEGDYSLSHLNSVSYVPTDITLNGTDLSFSNPDKWDITWKKTTAPTGGGGGGGGGGTGGDTLYNQMIEGDMYDKKTLTINIPTAYTKLSFMACELAGEKNSADMFVSKGTAPTVTSSSPYTYNAQCASIKPNREQEWCTFNGTTSGTWHVMLYGYNTYFFSRLIIIGNK